MATIHNLGFPRIGADRELKKALEAYWRGDSPSEALLETAAGLRARHWALQEKLDWVPVGDFSLYDHVLDTSFLLGNVPARAGGGEVDALTRYFRVARGRGADADACCAVRAGEMTKWFDTNYHYIVPEFERDTAFSLHAEGLLEALEQARDQGVKARPVILGPVSYLWLGKSRDGSERRELLPRLLPVYGELLRELARRGVDWVQIDEPALVMDLDEGWRHTFRLAYQALQGAGVRLLLTSYFGPLEDNLQLVCELPVAGVHLDAVRGRREITALADWLPDYKVLSLGVIDGRNVWKSDLNALLDELEPLHERLGERLWLAPSCSLLHVPVDLARETELDAEVRDWLAFATQKLDELDILGQALNRGRGAVAEALAANAESLARRRASARVVNPAVREAVAGITPAMGERNSPYAERAALQAERFRLPPYPTTTIGSFPQTGEIRQARRRHRAGELDEAAYQAEMRRQIERVIREQEALGLDVLVHGEPERNDMVEYFGEQLEGFVFTRYGWVQSYGSRCVKPPILFGDVTRPRPMTVDWSRYAQSLTGKPVKGMLTGPVTLLNWSFVRDDQPRAETCLQLALAIRAEVLDLEQAGIGIIQIDEAALREGLPLRRRDWKAYLDWAIESFRLSANGVADRTQIHTHMCYSEFNDIIDAIAAMDADVITIENSRSDSELLSVFERFEYPNAIGPGVYDIHSPNVPDSGEMQALIRRAECYIAPERLWINPDCGLKTRCWDEVLPALGNMVEAARALRESA